MTLNVQIRYLNILCSSSWNKLCPPIIAHFADMAAILNSIVLDIYYGMLRRQINMYLPPEHPIIDI